MAELKRLAELFGGGGDPGFSVASHRRTRTPVVFERRKKGAGAYLENYPPHYGATGFTPDPEMSRMDEVLGSEYPRVLVRRQSAAGEMTPEEQDTLRHELIHTASGGSDEPLAMAGSGEGRRPRPYYSLEEPHRMAEVSAIKLRGTDPGYALRVLSEFEPEIGRLTAEKLGLAEEFERRRKPKLASEGVRIPGPVPMRSRRIFGEE